MLFEVQGYTSDSVNKSSLSVSFAHSIAQLLEEGYYIILYVCAMAPPTNSQELLDCKH